MKTQRQEDLRIATEAAEWLERLEEQGPRQNAAFAQWLATSPRHVEAVLNVTAVERLFHETGAQQAIDMDALLATAMKRNVVELRTENKREATLLPSQAQPGKRRMLWGLAAAVTLAVGAGALWFGLFSGSAYSTGIGEQRTVQLSDGSTVNLGTRSKIRLEFSDSARDIYLDGEALFKVQRDPARPFRVHGGPAAVQAVGTQFNVHRRPSSTIVSVLEGVVLTESATGAVQLGIGQEASVDREGRIEERPLSSGAIAGRRHGRLIFSDDRLEDIVAEFNRWNQRQLKVADEVVAVRLYSGAFDADQPESLLAFLKRDPGLTIQERRNEILIRAHE